MKATIKNNGKEVRILGHFTLVHKNTGKAKYFIVATLPINTRCKPRLYYTSDINGMTQKKASELPPYKGKYSNLKIPRFMDPNYV